MIRIGEFSKLSRVSIRMLRHYDDIGLLKPVEIDPFTGYRYYEVDQLLVLGRITSLKNMGFKLVDIIKILDIYDDSSKLDSYLEERRNELEVIYKQTVFQITLLDNARNRLRKEDDMGYNILLKTIPERYAATVHMTIPRYEDEEMAWRIMIEETAHLNMVAAEPCLAAASFLDDEYKEEDVDLVVWKTVKGTYPDTEHVKFKTLPEVKVASCTIKGDYGQMNDCYAAIFAWINENGFSCAGPMFNIYHISPYETQNPDEFVTEVCYPIRFYEPGGKF